MGQHQVQRLTGTLRKLDWQNPHPYFFVDVKSRVARSSSGRSRPLAGHAASERHRPPGVLDNIDNDVSIRGCPLEDRKPNAAAAGTLKFSDGVMRQVGQLQD